MAETSTNEIRVGDAAWRQIEALLTAHDPAKRLGRKRAPQRMAADALAWRLATGLPWNRLPSRYGDDSTAHRTVQRWQRLGVYEQIAVHIAEDIDASEAAACACG